MENSKVLNALDEFAKTNPSDIPKELDEYLRYVAASGDPVYQWSLVKTFFRAKLNNVILEFFESCPMMDVPLSPNLDPFNFEIFKKRLLDRYDMFTGVPFTIQRIAELLTAPRKQYNRLDKFMRALEKNVWVVSTWEPGNREPTDQSSVINGVLPTTHALACSAEDNQERQPELFEGDEEDEDDEPSESTNGAEIDEPTKPTEESTDKAPGEPPSEEESELVPPLEPIEAETSTTSLDLLEKADDTEPEEPTPVDNKAAIEETESTGEPDLVESEEENQNTKTESDTGYEESVRGEVKEEEKTEVEDIVVTEVDESEITESIEELVVPAIVTEPPQEEDQTDEEEKPVEREEKVDLKRKIDDVIEEGEEAVPSKKLETEAEAPGHKLPKEDTPLEPIVEAVVEVLGVVEEEEAAEDKIVEEVVEVLEVAELEGEVEGEMESAEVEEKVEMLVEEPEQMEIDESSAQSPMAQEDVVEPMEQSEPGNS